MFNPHKKLTTLLCTATSVALCSTLFIPKATADTIEVEIVHWPIPFPPYHVPHEVIKKIKTWPNGPFEAGNHISGIRLAKTPAADIFLNALATGGSPGSPPVVPVAFDISMEPVSPLFSATTNGGSELVVIFETPIEYPGSSDHIDLSHLNIIFETPLPVDDSSLIDAFLIDKNGRQTFASLNDNPHPPIPETTPTAALLALGAVGVGALLKKSKSA